MRHRLLALLLALAACASIASSTARSQTRPGGCPTLPSGYAWTQGADRMAIVPPYTVRLTRAGASCEILLSACGADNTWTADDVIAAITDPVVARGLAQHAVLGDPNDPSPLVLEHGSDRLTVGRACPAIAGSTCRPVPPEVASMIRVLDGIHRYRFVPSQCPTLGPASPPSSAQSGH